MLLTIATQKLVFCLHSFFLTVLLFVLPPDRGFVKKVTPPVQNRVSFNVRDFGAKADGTTIDTKAINNAIDSAAAKGGGTIYFPAGIYASYSIHLKTNIGIYLEHGAVLLAAAPGASGYDDAEHNPWGDLKYQDFGHSHWHNSLIWAEDAENISITGPGLINGSGLSRGLERQKPGMGNKAIAFKNCRNVILRDFTILNGGHFGVLATGVHHLTVDNIRMDTNRDGIDIDCCRNVRVSNCSINTPYDDAICLKSSFALGKAIATENVIISNCGVSGYDLGSFYDGSYRRNEWKKVPDREGPTGRIKAGTESNGGFRNIAITNCVFSFCRGLALETVDGGSIEDVTISNITMRDVTNSPIFLRLGGRLRGPQGTTVGALRRVTISNLIAYNADSHFASIIAGIPGHPVEDILLENVRLYYRPMDSSASAIQKEVPEHIKTYPEPAKMGVMPAYGFFVRHASSIRLHHVSVQFSGSEIRPAIYAEDVEELKIDGGSLMRGHEASRIDLRNIRRLTITDTEGMKNIRKEKVRNASW